MPRGKTSASGSSLARTVPLGYIGVAIGLAALLLPSILRPPQDLQNTTAAFSPDAPPDDTPPEAIIQAVKQAASSTAGAAVETEQEVIIEEVVVEEGPPPEKKAVRAGCYGDPPRQTESLYSHLCVPAWTGTDNGGETHRGVTADEIRIGVGVPLDDPAQEGRLDREFSTADTETVRLLKVWQTYFNERFEFYGRYLQFYVFKVSSSNEDSARAAVRDAATRHGGMFAMILPGPETTNAATSNELVRQGIITFAFDNNPVPFYKDAHPFAYSFEMDSWQTRFLSTELICKQWVGKPPGELNGGAEIGVAPDLSDPNRKFGLIVYQDELRTGATEMFKEGLARCGGEFVATQEYNLNDDVQAIAGSVTKMRQAGATTIVVAVDPLTPAVLTNEAERSAYQPEWICVTGCETNGSGRLLQDNQAEHFVSVGINEIPRVDIDKDWYRAYKEIDPEGVPDAEYFRDLQQLAGGIQHAGEIITPASFWTGLKSQPCRTPEPVWSIGGCYSDADPSSDVHYLGDFTYSDFVSLLWFDNAGEDPNSASAGAWCWMDFGARYRLGEMPSTPLPFRDPSSCYFTPPRGEQG